jgi:hypothetical protein
MTDNEHSGYPESAYAGDVYWRKDDEGTYIEVDAGEFLGGRHKAPEIPPRVSVLREAERLTTGDRNVTYGSPTANFQNTADLWTVLLQPLLKDGARLEPRHVADLMVALKLARNMAVAKRDNFVDIAGYAACGYETTVEDS